MRRFRLVLLVAIALVLGLPISAQAAKRPMTFDDMMHMKRLGDTAVSHDGKWLGYSVTTVDLDANTRTPELFLQKIEGGDPIALAVGKPGDSGLQFSPDDKHILFLSGREGDKQEIWIADFDSTTGATTNAKKLTNLSSEADNAKWSPDANSIVFTSAVYPDCPAITESDFATGDKCNSDRDAALAASKVKAQIFTHLLYRHWNHFTGDKRSHLFLVLVDSGAMRDLNPGDTRNAPPDYPTDPVGCGCDISPDSKELAFMENPDPVPAISTSAQIYTLDLADPAAKPMKISTSAGGNLNPAYSPDGKYLAWRSQARAGYESDRFRLVVYEREKKTIRDLLPHFDRWVDEFTWGSDSNEIYIAAGDVGEQPVLRASVPDGRLTIDTLVGEYSGLTRIGNEPRLIASRMTVSDPGEVVVLSMLNFTEWSPGSRSFDEHSSPDNLDSQNHPSSGAVVANSHYDQLTHLNDALLAQLDLPKMESFWFTASDGVKVQGFLIPPPGYDPHVKYPTKLLIHGGPQGAWGDSWSYRWNAELFAANGYVVVMINPRGSTGYGQAFVDGVNGDWGGKPYTDLMTGLDYAEQHYPFIDKSRECALGASYGGYMANWILGHTNRFKCIVSHDGMFNAESAFGSTEEDWFNIWEFRGRPWDFYGRPDSENPFRKWSPSLSTKNFKTPTLVIHSQLDYRLDVSEGLQLFDTLQLLGVPSKMLYFPDEGHWVLKPQNSRLWYKTVNDWVDEWTGRQGTGNRD